MKTIRILFFFDQKISSYILAYFKLEWNPNHNTTCFFILLTNFCRKKVSPNLKAKSSIGFLLQKCQNKGPVKIRHITLCTSKISNITSITDVIMQHILKTAVIISPSHVTCSCTETKLMLNAPLSLIARCCDHTFNSTIQKNMKVVKSLPSIAQLCSY